MRNYLPKKHKEYLMPRSLYLRVLGTVRDYDRLIESRDDIFNGNKLTAGAPYQKLGGRPTESRGITLALIEKDIDAIEQALFLVPEEYRQYVFDNVRYGWRFPSIAARNTWSKWRMYFLFQVAKNLNLL